MASAQTAFESWKGSKPAARREIFLKAAQIIEKNGVELGQYMGEEAGAPKSWGVGFNVPLSVNMFQDVAGRILDI